MNRWDDQSKHIVMLYDDAQKRDRVLARYFQEAWHAGATCVLHTAEDPQVRAAMLADCGLDVSSDATAKRLHILDTGTPEHRGQSRPATSREDVARWTADAEGPLYVATEATMGQSFGRDVEQHLHGEEVAQESFAELGMSLLCMYDLTKLKGPHLADWIRGLLASHHRVIYASDAGKAVAFDTDLLEEAD